MQSQRGKNVGHMAKTLVLVDDHHIVRHGLRSLLESEPDLSVVGEAASGFEGIRLADRLQPDVLVCDLEMAGLSGFEVTTEVRKCSPKTAVVIISEHADDKYAIEALRCGAKAYIMKNAPTHEVTTGIREVSDGRRYLCPSLAQRAIDAYEVSGGGLDDGKLSKREREVLRLVVQGNQSADIAAQMSISRRTAEVHRYNLMRKLGLHNRRELVDYATQRGLLPAG